MPELVSWESIGKGNGRMRIAVLGTGTEASLIPIAHRAGLKELGIENEIVCANPEMMEFDSCIQHLAANGFSGASVGTPHKVSAARVGTKFFIDRHSLGVATALHLTKGTYAQNTEVAAFKETIRDFEPATALVMGAGHGARSVVLGLLDAGWNIKIWNRNAMKSRLLQSLLQRYGKIDLVSEADPTGCKMVVNTTPLGLKIGEKTPLIWKHVQPKTTIYDLVYRRVPTELIREAKNRGLKTIDGKELLVEQSAIALEWFLDKKVPREPMRQAVHNAVFQQSV